MRFRGTLTVLALQFGSVLALATPRAIPYTGRLDANGIPLTGSYDLRFALVRDPLQDLTCLTGTAPMPSCAEWFDTMSGVHVAGGRFSVELGGVAHPISADTLRAPALYVGVAVKGPNDPAFVLLGGRHQVGAVPYAVVPEVGVPPIGSIIAWHQNLPGVPALSAESGWVPCDGSVVRDPQSPLDGTQLPDLNGPQGRFLRGGAVSGTYQEDMLRTHKHLDQGHTHAYQRPPYFDFEITPGGIIRSPTGYDGTARYPATSSSNAVLGAPVELDGTALPAQGPETRPRNMSVVWIIRIK